MLFRLAVNPQVDAGDGSDYSYRMTIEGRYKASAAAKNGLKGLMVPYATLFVLGAAALYLGGGDAPAVPREALVALLAASSFLPGGLTNACTGKSFSVGLCNITMYCCAGLTFALTAAASLCLSADVSSLGVLGFAGAATGLGCTNVYAATRVRTLRNNAGYGKKK